MKKRMAGVLILGLIAVAGFSTGAFAEEEACSQGMKMGMHEKMMGAKCECMEQKKGLEEMFNRKERLIMDNAAELGLSDDQIEKIKTLKLSTKKAGIKSDADIEVLAIDIEDALGKDEVNADSTNALIEKKYALKLQAAKTLVSAYAGLKKVLTKDQMEKLHGLRKMDKMDKMDKMEKMEKDKGMMMNMKK